MVDSAGRRRPTRAETRRLVLDTAARVFARRGLAATSMNDVAAAAGLTKGAIYSSFESKDDLVLAIMEEHVEERMRHATRAFDEISDLGDATAAAGLRMLAGVDTDFTWHRLLLEYWGMAMSDPDVRAGLARRRGAMRAALAGAIDRIARHRGVALPLPAEELAVTLLALSNGLAVERGIDADAVPAHLFGAVLALLVGTRSL